MSAKEDPKMLRSMLANEIRHRRKQLGISQEELGFRCGLHRTYISLVERCLRSPTIDSLSKIAFALGVRTYELLSHAEDHITGGNDDA